MSQLSERQVKELDIDWYCLVNGAPTHIASMGGMIPAQFRDREKLRKQQDVVALLVPAMDVNLNIEFIQNQISEGYEYLQDESIREAVEIANENHPGFQYLRDYDLPVRLFASTFVEKARRGFRSFARREGVEGNEYVLVAEPANAVGNIEGLPQLEALECELRNGGATIII